MKKLAILPIICMFALSGLHAQKAVSGKVTAFNRYPVVNVEVSAKKSGAVVKTDSLGRFTIVCEKKDVIRLKPVAFEATSRKVGKQTDSLTINLIFIDKPENRERAVNNGYIRSEDLAFAVEHLAHENNDFCMYNNIMDLLRGKITGIQINGSCVVIRGSTTIEGDPCALFVVDGVMTENIDWILPCQVSSLNVLKGGSAAMYGNRGANGVIVIETKK